MLRAHGHLRMALLRTRGLPSALAAASTRRPGPTAGRTTLPVVHDVQHAVDSHRGWESLQFSMGIQDSDSDCQAHSRGATGGYVM